MRRAPGNGPHDAVPQIGTPVSLGVIAVVLAVVTVASLITTRRDPSARAHAGSVTGRRDKPTTGRAKGRSGP